MILTILKGILAAAEVAVICDGVKKLPKRKTRKNRKPRGCLSFSIERR